MQYRFAQSRLVRVTRLNHGLWVALLVCAFCNAVLAVGWYRHIGAHTVVLVPAGLRETATVTPHAVSASYLEALAMMLMNDRLNISVETVAAHNHHFLQFVDPRYVAAFRTQLQREEAEIRADQVSSVFYVQKIAAHPDHGWVTLTGLLKRWVGERVIRERVVRYRLRFSVQAYALLLTGFEEEPLPAAESA